MRRIIQNTTAIAATLAMIVPQTGWAEMRLPEAQATEQGAARSAEMPELAARLQAELDAGLTPEALVCADDTPRPCADDVALETPDGIAVELSEGGAIILAPRDDQSLTALAGAAASAVAADTAVAVDSAAETASETAGDLAAALADATAPAPDAAAEAEAAAQEADAAAAAAAAQEAEAAAAAAQEAEAAAAQEAADKAAAEAEQAAAAQKAADEAAAKAAAEAEQAAVQKATEDAAAQAAAEAEAAAAAEAAQAADAAKAAEAEAAAAATAPAAPDAPVENALTDTPAAPATETATDTAAAPAPAEPAAAPAPSAPATAAAPAPAADDLEAALKAAAETAPEVGAKETAAAQEAAAEEAAPAVAALNDTAAATAPAVEETVTAENSRSSAEDFEASLRDALAQAGQTTAAAPQQQQAPAASGGSSDSDLTKALILGLGAVAVGTMLANNRQVALATPDRVIVQAPDGSQQVIKDEVALLRQPGSTVTTENFDDGSSRTIVTRQDGSKVVTIRDANLRVLRRTLISADGTTTQLIDDTASVEPVDVSALPPAARPVVAPASGVMNENELRAALATEAQINRRFTLGQIRNIPEVRALVAPVDIAAITFDTGSAAIKPDQAQQLATLGRVIADKVRQNPREIFMIEGHTDTVGAETMNLALSDRRAESVALALTEYFQVPPENMVVQGYGEQFLKVRREGDIRENRRASVRRITDLLQTASN